MKPIKVVIIGAGSKNFGKNTIKDLLSSNELRKTDLHISLVDIDESALDRVFRLALMLKEYRRSNAKIEATTDRREALQDADYVITAVAMKRYEFWDRDLFMPYAFGFKHTLGENGGPGAAFHTLRSLQLMIPIAKDMERICPSALLISYTNPVSRICMGVNMLTNIDFVGLCHGAFATLEEVAKILGRQTDQIDITIGGLNHFHWVLEIRDKISDENLYHEFNRRMYERKFELESLTETMYETFGILPFPSDIHISEYVQFAYDVTGPFFHHPVWMTWQNRMLGMDWKGTGVEGWKGEWGDEADPIQQIIDGKKPLTEKFTQPSKELAVPIICDIEFDRKRREIAVNIPNEDLAISNLPDYSIVEIPAVVDANGLHPVKVGPLPEAIAAMCRTQISIQKLLVEAYAQNSKKLLLQALAIDPTVDSIPRAKKLLEKMLSAQRGFLPDFGD